MAKNRRLDKGISKPMGLEMISLIEEIQEKFNQIHGFKPTIIDITNMLARALRLKKIYLT